MSVQNISIIINNRQVTVRASASVLQACEEAGYDVPRFCYHEKLSVAGNCRMCLVEVQKSPKPVVSCAMPVSKGMVIFTDTPLVKKAREAVLEFLLINHPLDCPICDQGGECDLQDETLHYGSDRGRYHEYKRSVEDKECGPIIKTIMTRCIHCTRCVRFAAEIAGQETLGAFGRGQDTEIGTYIQSFIKTELSGNLVDLCPVGALTSKPYAFMARNWELQRGETIDFFDGLCSDIVVHTRKFSASQFQNGKAILTSSEDIVRILPKTTGLYNDNWISDRTRYAFDGLKNQRLLTPMQVDRKLGVRPVKWDELLLDITERLDTHYYVAVTSEKEPKQSSRFGAIFGNLSDLEGIYLLSQFIKLCGNSDIQVGNFKLKLNFDLPFFYSFNRTINSLNNLGALLLIGLNTRYESSVLNSYLRKHQLARALPYATIGAYSSLRLRQNHEGNSLRALLAVAENKTSLTSTFYNLTNPSIFFGVETLRIKNGSFLKNIITFLGKKFFTKTKQGERFSGVHSNVSTLNFAHLGLTAGVRSPFHSSRHKDKELSTLFTHQMNDFKAQKWLSAKNYTHVVALTTNKVNFGGNDHLVPLKSFYEKDGFLFNIEGRLRKFKKIVSPSPNVRSLESFVVALSTLQADWYRSLSSFWNLEEEFSLVALTEKVPTSFNVNPFQFWEEENQGILSPFAPAVTNFYLNDVISSSSVTMGECALFFNKEGNFYKDN